MNVLSTSLVALLLTTGVIVGRDFIEIKSAYDGDGWFSYTFRRLEDPCITNLSVASVWPFITNRLDSTAGQSYTNVFGTNGWLGFRWNQSMGRPMLVSEEVFRVKTPYHHFKQSTNRAWGELVFTLADPITLPGLGKYIAGIFAFSCLTPCPAEEADNSEPQVTTRFEFVKDIKIEKLIYKYGEAHGVTFSWNQQSTVELQGSHNLTTWSPITRFFGTPPKTIWTTNQSLNEFGQYFRLELLATGHLTNNVAAVRMPQASVLPVKYTFERGALVVHFPSSPGKAYQVNLCDNSGVAAETQILLADSVQTSATFKSATLASFCYASAQQLE